MSDCKPGLHWWKSRLGDEAECADCGTEGVIIPATGNFIVIDGVAVKDPTPAQVLAAFGCSSR